VANLNIQVIQSSLSGFAALEYRGHYEVRASLPVGTTPEKSGRQPTFRASPVMYFLMAPMVTVLRPSFGVSVPSHR
jgi:hypothetical protein